jgi:hypothetical protein
MSFPVPPNNLIDIVDRNPAAVERLREKGRRLQRARRDDRGNLWKTPADGGGPDTGNG